MTLFVDHEALDSISRTLGAAGMDVDSVGSSAPSGVDGGDGTPALLGILAHLTDAAGQLVVSLSAASSAVAEANSSYRGQDGENADKLNKSQWEVR
ncbi:hypothetical protein [Antrihabitans cavernicola]|uniref:ESX-1 secretion-associated protein n=1 Tax=Antrihabitans cavernicola TaxID=2495913 RepID=A0A5A7SDA8_9NOCA|nr:hypothetical protein [Spelaeibacter cavernicola]KAA0022475.1 hypothetical protein FOY51_12250 [Spelaeibacter cavernicola]